MAELNREAVRREALLTPEQRLIRMFQFSRFVSSFAASREREVERAPSQLWRERRRTSS